MARKDALIHREMINRSHHNRYFYIGILITLRYIVLVTDSFPLSFQNPKEPRGRVACWREGVEGGVGWGDADD